MVPEELWTKVPNIVQEAVTKAISKKKKWKEAKWLCEEALQTAEEKERKGKGKGKDILIWMQSSREEQGETRKPF